ALNRMTGQTFQDGSSTAGSYDANGRVVGVVDFTGGTFAYTYDAAGHLASQSSPFGTVKYTYDAAGKVVSRQVVGQAAVSYSYDAANDPSLFTTSFSSVQAVMNKFDAGGRLTQSGATTYAYDDNGNLILSTDTSGNTSYSWDTRNRLQSVSAPNGQKTTLLY